MSTFPDYYAVLGVDPSADAHQIRDAYKRESLKNHPDRNGCTEESTRKFQEVADAYYVLSDKPRRDAYDQAYQAAYGAQSRAKPSASQWSNIHAEADSQFGDVFYELLRPEVENPSRAWGLAGTLSGAVLGFIIANVPGAVLGGYAGNKLGTVRDNKGKSVMEVFNTFSHQRKYAILSAIAAKVLL